MAELKCQTCGETASYADASIADKLRTCQATRTVMYTAIGEMKNGVEHNWVEA